MARIHAADWDALDGNEPQEWAAHLKQMTFSFYSGSTLFYKDGNYTIAIHGYFPPQGGGEAPGTYPSDAKVDYVQMIDNTNGLGFSIYELNTTFGEVLASSSPYDLGGTGLLDVYGSRLDDTASGLSFGAIYNGDEGTDTLVLSGTSYDYSIESSYSSTFGWNSQVYAAGGSFPDPKISLFGVEVIQFDNGKLYIDGSQPNTLDLKPTSLALSANTLLENQAKGVEIGEFSAVDPEGKPLTYILADDVGGAFKLDGTKLVANQAFDAETQSSYSVTLMVRDAYGFEVAKTFQIEIGNVDEAPTLAKPLSDASSPEDEAFSFTVPAGTFSDVDSQLLYSAALANGDALPSWLKFDPTTHTFTGTPANGDVGRISIKVTATDGSGSSISDTFDLTVQNVNDAPTGSATASLSHGLEDTAYVVAASNLLAGFSDSDGDELAIDALGASGGASVKDNGDGTYTIAPAADTNGTVTLNYSVIDGHGGSVEATQTVIFDAINDGPVATNDSGHMLEHESVTLSVLANDSDPEGDSLTVKDASVTSGNGTVMINADGTVTLTYTGANIEAGEQAQIVVAYTATDGSANSAATLTITVDGVEYDPGDPIKGSAKGNTLSGTEFGEKLYGLGGNDKINGHGGADEIDGGKGSDSLTGEAGADTFIFAKGYGEDTIGDFQARGAGHDKIDLSGLPAIENFKDLKAHHLDDHGKDVWIDAGKDMLVIKHVEIHDLTKGDFLF